MTAQHTIDFTTRFDLEVEGKTLFGVEFSISPDGNYRYRVPDCIRPPDSDITKSPKFVNQCTIDGITTVSNDAFNAALIKKVEKDFPCSDFSNE